MHEQGLPIFCIGTEHVPTRPATSPRLRYTVVAMDARSSALKASYDAVAASYAAKFMTELDHKPLDRALLDCFAELVRGPAPVLDVGCGPGQITRALHARGLEVTGVDLSDAMVAVAREAHPAIAFEQGSMLALAAEASTYAGITAFYSIVHLEAPHVRVAFREFHRVLCAGGYALVAFHRGSDRVHLDTWWDASVDLDFVFHERAFVEAELLAAGFTLEAWVERAPYTAVEHPSTRAYVLARKP